MVASGIRGEKFARPFKLNSRRLEGRTFSGRNFLPTGNGLAGGWNKRLTGRNVINGTTILFRELGATSDPLKVLQISRAYHLKNVLRQRSPVTCWPALSKYEDRCIHS